MAVWETYTKNKLTRLWKARIDKIREVTESLSIEVGVLEEASPEVKTKALVAEFGNPRKNVPARMPISKGLREQQEALRKPLQMLAKSIVHKTIGRNSLVSLQAEKLAKTAANLMRRRIRAQLPPPLKDETIQRKKLRKFRFSTLALYASGDFYRAITGKVVHK